MGFISEVDHLYKFERASAEPDDMAVQVLFLTDKLRRLRNEIDQFDDVYDTIEKQDVASLGASSNLSGAYAIFQDVGQTIGSASETALQFTTSRGSTEGSRISWSSVGGESSKIIINSLSTEEAYLFSGTIHWTSNIAGTRQLSIGGTTISRIETRTTAVNSQAISFIHGIQGQASSFTVVIEALQDSGGNLTATMELYVARLR